MLAVRGQELDLIGNAEKLIAENADLSVRLTAAVDRLVAEAETEVSSSAKGALSVQQLSARVLLVFAALSLISSILIVWLYVGRNIIRRLTRLSGGMLAIAGGSHASPRSTFPAADEVAEMGRVVEVFRKNTLERDELLAEKRAGRRPAGAAGQGAHRRAGTIGRGAARPRRGQPGGQLDDRPRDRAVHDRRQGGAAFRHRGRHDLCVRRGEPGIPAARDLRNGRCDHRRDPGRHLRIGETAVGEAARAAHADPDSGHSARSVGARPRCHRPRRLPRPAGRAAARCRPDRRRAGGAPQGSRANFPSSTVDLLQTFAAQSVLAIQNANLFAELEDKSRQLEMASQHKSQFLASMSHELRTPLNAIIGLTEMVVGNAARFGAEKAQEPLQRVHRAGTHLLGLINQVLDLSKIEAGKLELNPESVKLAPLIDEVIGTAAQLAEQNNNRLVVESEDNLGADRRRPHAAAADPAQSVEQCLQVHQAGRGRAAGATSGRRRATGSSLPSPIPASA